MTTLRLMIPSDWDAILDSFDWVILDHQNHIVRRGKDLLDALPQCDETEVVIPACMVGFISTQVPQGNRTRIQTALPFLVEDYLITPPEDVHAVVAGNFTDYILIAVIQKKWLKKLLERLSRSGIYPQKLFPETLLPETPSGAWAVMSRSHASFIRTYSDQGFPLSIDINDQVPPFMLSLAIDQTPEENRPTQLLIYGDMPKYVENWEQELGIPIHLANEQEWFVSGITPRLNLLQGELEPSGGIERRLKVFMPLAVTASVIFLIHFVFSLADFAFKTNESQKLDQEMTVLFKATFPNATSIVDAPLQMQRNLDELKHSSGQSGNNDFISLLSGVTSTLGSVSAEKLQGMEYHDGKLILHLLSPDREQVEAMRQRLGSAGLTATLENLHPMTQGVELQLSVSGRAL